ncbi:NEP1-interacting protein 2 [Camellia lanceoleosa]|uniref:NEP1-interacting protein 2 n=1 Tax=Camellia lanceoleosa TaxID=1840588 RepID=A0ACC0GUC7_9ERIC|nr:NEP1-interacting protein 2 [Camellia lanceoleosa]
MEVWSCPTIPTLQRPWWWWWVSIGGEEERRRKRELCSSVFSALLHFLFYAFFSFFFAVVGTTIGAMTGAVLGMKSERKIGLVHGAAVGAFTGASFSLHAVSVAFSLWISFHDNEPPSFSLFIEVITSLLKPTLVYLGEEFGTGMHGPVRNQVKQWCVTDVAAGVVLALFLSSFLFG